jgi:hypothetical protein
VRRIITALAALPALLLCACGSGGSGSQPIASPNTSNVVAMSVNAGPTALPAPAVNIPYVSVKVCAPGSTTNCQTIDDIQVDTGSYGLRIISTALSISLPAVSSSGGPLLECVEFGDGYVWGPVATADVYIGGETASDIPVHIMGGSSFPVPDDCASSALGPEEDTVPTFGANGLLGVGPFAEDCGQACAAAFQSGGGAAYYSCPSTCTGIALAENLQVINPVVDFTTDNNGVIVELPQISGSGQASASGSLVFGIGTESNNALPSSDSVLTGDTSFGDSSSGDITITYNGNVFPQGYIDSGSTLIFFNDSTIQQCTSAEGFYCPATTLGLSAVNEGANGTTSTVDFNIANAETLLDDNSTFTAFNDLGGPIVGDNETFDFGLPFFYGLNVAVAIYGQETPEGEGPYFAYQTP